MYFLPFFNAKAQASGGADPNGTRGLDIIANGLPTYFSLNATNAQILLGHLTHWDQPVSYQAITQEIEGAARKLGDTVMVSVLGDEDNPQ